MPQSASAPARYARVERAAELRRRLASLKACGQVKVGKGNVPAGCRLFVQSTSPNRKVSGELLIEAGPGALPPRAAPPAKAARVAGKPGRGGGGGGSEDDNDDGDHDGGDAGGDSISVNWPVLDSVWDAAGFEPEDLTLGSPSVGVCDEPVPQAALDRTLRRIDALANAVKDWKQTRSKEAESGLPTSITFTSPSTGARLQHCACDTCSAASCEVFALC